MKPKSLCTASQWQPLSHTPVVRKAHDTTNNNNTTNYNNNNNDNNNCNNNNNKKKNSPTSCWPKSFLNAFFSLSKMLNITSILLPSFQSWGKRSVQHCWTLLTGQQRTKLHLNSNVEICTTDVRFLCLNKPELIELSTSVSVSKNIIFAPFRVKRLTFFNFSYQDCFL